MTPGPERTIAQILAQSQSAGLDRLDAQLLLLHVLGRQPHDRAWLIAHDDDKVSSSVAICLDLLIKRRLSGEPVAYLNGHKEFFGMDLEVDARVLVPRPDTEILVEWALEVLSGMASANVVDLGTGSGAIALAIKKHHPAFQVQGVDSSADALAVAAANAERLQLDVLFRESFWLTGVIEKFDLVVSNPPYIADHDPHLAALTHEPEQALTSGADGLDDIRRIVAQAPDHLQPGGWLLLEHGYNQAVAVRQLLSHASFLQVQSRKDLAGMERCSGGQWRATPQSA
jgi:release factor glutamine methyltransferase